MARVSINENILNDIGDSIRSKLGTEINYAPQNMSRAIDNIESLNLMQGNIIANGEYYPSGDKNGFSKVIVNVPQGIAPTGNINITTLQSVDVSAYATAQVVDANIIPTNIKKDVNILGILGTYDGGGGASGPLRFVAPYKEDITSGYVYDGTWIYSTSYPNLNSTIYNVEAGKNYLFMAGARSERFRAMFTTVDVSQATSDVSGTSLYDENSVNSYYARAYSATQNGYVVVYVGDQEKRVYGFEGALA